MVEEMDVDLTAGVVIGWLWRMCNLMLKFDWPELLMWQITVLMWNALKTLWIELVWITILLSIHSIFLLFIFPSIPSFLCGF